MKSFISTSGALVAFILCGLASPCATLVDARFPRWNQLTDPATGEHRYTYAMFHKQMNHKFPTGSAEYKKRERVFRENLDFFHLHNSDGTQAYTVGVNQFADMTSEEVERKMCGLKRVSPTVAPPTRVHHVPNSVRAAGIGGLPHSIDYRSYSPPVITGVKSQGNCADCWAHAAAEEIESFYALKTGDLHVLSQQQITSCTNISTCSTTGYGGCMGGSPQLGILQAGQNQAGGLFSNWEYPFVDYMTEQDAAPCRLPMSLPVQYPKPEVTTTGYVEVPQNDALALMHALATEGPIGVGVDGRAWAYFEGGVFTNVAVNQSQFNWNLNHAVQLVGYGYDDDVGMDYWIIRNSWGAWWGEHGYIKLARYTSANDDSPKNKMKGHTNMTEPCGWDLQQYFNCNASKSTPQWVCGTSAVLCDAYYPIVGEGNPPPW